MSEIIHFLSENMTMIYLIIFTIFLGFEIISKVPTVLHTPLMSGSNAISGVVIIGAIILMRTTPPENKITMLIATIAIILGTINVVGGFAVTSRMLEMFNRKKKK